MNIVIVDKKDAKIKTADDVVVIEGQKVPFRLIDTLLLVGSVALDGRDITRISAAGVTLLFLSSNYKESAIVVNAAGKSAELKLSQYKTALRAPMSVAREILRKKISTHTEQLKGYNIVLDPAPYYAKIDEAQTLDGLLGVEGSFSRSYFEHYFSLFPKKLHKGKRSKRPPLDPLNALLSLYYTLCYNLIAVRLLGFGFETGIGFLHRPFRDHHALASDLLELFRTDINAFVYGIFSRKLVGANDFTKKGGVYLRYEGRRKLWREFRTFYKELEARIDSEIAWLRGLL